MVETVAGWIFGILAILFVAGTVVWNITRLIKVIHCRKVTYPCKNVQCIWRNSCDKYDETMELLNFRIEILRQQIRNDELKKRGE